MFTKDKKIIFLTILAVLSFMTGCGQAVTGSGGTSEEQSRSYGFEFQVEDVFALTTGGVVVTGYVQSGTMRTGDGAWLVKEDGTALETGVEGMEIYDKEKEGTIYTEEVSEGIPVGVLLRGLEKDQVDIGDRLLGQEKE